MHFMVYWVCFGVMNTCLIEYEIALSLIFESSCSGAYVFQLVLLEIVASWIGVSEYSAIGNVLVPL